MVSRSFLCSVSCGGSAVVGAAFSYFGKLLEMQSDGDKDKFAAAVTHGEYAGSMKDLINLAQNLDCYWLYPTVSAVMPTLSIAA